MQKDARMGSGYWRGCHSFTDIICDGDSFQESRDGGLKMGGLYWYYYLLDDDTEFHDSTEPSTTSCPFLPGQEVNILEVPIQMATEHSDRSGSISSFTSTRYAFTLNPDDKYRNLKPANPLSSNAIKAAIEDLYVNSASQPPTPQPADLVDNEARCKQPAALEPPLRMLRAKSAPHLRQASVQNAFDRQRTFRSSWNGHGTENRIMEPSPRMVEPVNGPEEVLPDPKVVPDPDPDSYPTGRASPRPWDSEEYSRSSISDFSLDLVAFPSDACMNTPVDGLYYSSPFCDSPTLHPVAGHDINSTRLYLATSPDDEDWNRDDHLDYSTQEPLTPNVDLFMKSWLLTDDTDSDYDRYHADIDTDDNAQPLTLISDIPELEKYDMISPLTRIETNERGERHLVECGGDLCLDRCGLQHSSSVTSSNRMSDMISSSLSTTTGCTGYAGQPPTPLNSEFDALSIDPHHEDESSQQLDDAVLDIANSESLAAYLDTGGFHGYSLKEDEYASALTLRLPPTASSKSPRSDFSLFEQKSGNDLVEAWNDGSEDRKTSLQEIIDDLGYLGGAIV